MGICKLPPIYVLPAFIYNEYGVVIVPEGALSIYRVYADPVVVPEVAGWAKYVK